MERKIINIIVAFCILILGAGIYFFLFTNRTLMQVGDYTIKSNDTKFKDKINNIFYPNNKESYGLSQLEKSFVYAQILKNNGLEITESMIRQEEMRINQNTKDPERLKEIQKLFGDDIESYRKVFILPTLAERVLYYDYFSNNPKAQEKSIAKANAVLTEIKNGKKNFKAVAQEMSLGYQVFTASKNDGIIYLNQPETYEQDSGIKDISKKQQVPLNIQKQLDEERKLQTIELAKFWIDKIAPSVKPGQIVEPPINFGETWIIARYSKRINSNTHQFETISIPKDNFDEWLRAEKEKIKISK